MEYTGKDVLELGIPQGPHIGKMLKACRQLLAYSGGMTRTETREAMDIQCLRMWGKTKMEHAAVIAAQRPLKEAGTTPWGMYLDPLPDDPDEIANMRSVRTTMNQLMQTPNVTGGAIMPDACPAGTIPVGAIATSTDIHPGYHSADICCSMFMSIYETETDKKKLLDDFQDATEFGNSKGRGRYPLPDDLAQRIMENKFTAPSIHAARAQLGTQGDGNHFAFVGEMESTGMATLVTHHGSRGFGAGVYTKGMAVAEGYRKRISPQTPPGSAWIPADTEDGEAYWEALQIVRDWTHLNHTVLHDATGVVPHTRIWNEHNFVFRKEDGLFYHAKGATPTGFKWAKDATPFSIIPLNMAEPILIVRAHPLAPDGTLGFAPHGAGRNYSRTEHNRRGIADLATETAGLDVRFFCGRADPSELPSAYKNARAIQAEIERYKLALVVDRVLPYGTIMAGDWAYDAAWNVKRRKQRIAGRPRPDIIESPRAPQDRARDTRAPVQGTPRKPRK